MKDVAIKSVRGRAKQRGQDGAYFCAGPAGERRTEASQNGSAIKIKLDSVDPFWPEVHMTLDHLPIVIGGDVDADVQLDDRWVERRHCEISQVNGEPVVCSIESKRNTLVNGRRVRQAVLESGDHLTVGIRMFCVSYERSVGRTPGCANLYVKSCQPLCLK